MMSPGASKAGPPPRGGSERGQHTPRTAGGPASRRAHRRECPLRRQAAGRERRLRRSHRASGARSGHGRRRPRGARRPAGLVAGGWQALDRRRSRDGRRCGGLPAPGRAGRPGDRDAAAGAPRRARCRSRRHRGVQPVARAGLAHPVRTHRPAGRLADERSRGRRAERRAQHLRDAGPGHRCVGSTEPDVRLADGVHLRSRRRPRRPRDGHGLPRRPLVARGHDLVGGEPVLPVVVPRRPAAPAAGTAPGLAALAGRLRGGQRQARSVQHRARPAAGGAVRMDGRGG